MPKMIAIACLFTALLVTQVCAFEVGETVVTIRECEFKEGKVVIKKAFVGEQFSVQAVDGRRLLLDGAATAWVENGEDFVSLEPAVEHFTRLIEKNPSDWQSLCARGRAHEELGLKSTGMKDLEEAVRLHPSSETYRHRGKAYANRGMKQTALADFDEAIRLDSRSVAAYRDRATQFGDLKEHEKSLADINKAVVIEPKSAYLLIFRGWMFWKTRFRRKHCVMPMTRSD